MNYAKHRAVDQVRTAALRKHLTAFSTTLELEGLPAKARNLISGAPLVSGSVHANTAHARRVFFLVEVMT